MKKKFIFDDDISGKEIKDEYIKRKYLNTDYISKIRLFFGGNEIYGGVYYFSIKLRVIILFKLISINLIKKKL